MLEENLAVIRSLKFQVNSEVPSSSMSAGLNAVSAVFVQDWIRGWNLSSLTENQASWTMKIVVIIMGVLTVALVFVVENLGMVFQVGHSNIHFFLIISWYDIGLPTAFRESLLLVSWTDDNNILVRIVSALGDEHGEINWSFGGVFLENNEIFEKKKISFVCQSGCSSWSGCSGALRSTNHDSRPGISGPRLTALPRKVCVRRRMCRDV